MSSSVAPSINLAATIKTCKTKAQEALNSLPAERSSQDQNIAWLERQLSHLIAQLQAMLMEIESGSPIGSGLWDELELIEMLDDSVTEISNLKSLIQSLRSLGR